MRNPALTLAFALAVAGSAGCAGQLREAIRERMLDKLPVKGDG